LTSAVDGDPPSVSVTFVSSTFDNAAGATDAYTFAPDAFKMSPLVAAFGSFSVDHSGATPTPPERRYDPTATSASRASE
jgi:hypothetical protein